MMNTTAEEAMGLPAGWRTMATDILANMLDSYYLIEAEDAAELIEDELAKREDADNELGQHYDSPSIQDTLPDGIFPSYAN